MSDKQRETWLRVHGDNILECERALSLIADSFSATVRWIASPPYLPRYEIVHNAKVLFTIELFSGHGRWGVNLQDVIRSCGAPLREAADAIVTRVSPGKEQEEVVFAFEFCNALPAGNNAWQRNGRALACATVGVPYLYFAEVGGVELGLGRRIKAPRFPNPIVPFSYLTADKLFNVVCLPVYLPSPSSSDAMRIRFAAVFGREEGQRLVRSILESTALDDPHKKLIQKALVVTEILAAQRKSVDTLRGQQWVEILDLETADQKADWLGQNRMAWSRKGAGKVTVTETLQDLAHLFQDVGGISIGAKDIPLGLIPKQTRRDLAERLAVLYGAAITAEFTRWVASSDSPLIVAWITGFKPRGDDSRPDRGLVPLARMLFGDDIPILSIVSGPARPAMWKALQDSPQQLARQNGLWEAIVNLSDAILVDSTTSARGPFSLLLQREHRRFREKVHFLPASPITAFSEHDVDSTLHLLFARQEAKGVFEAMCNPPGGDWSGLSILNFETNEESRWTSLPRVSATDGKRPDHVIQFWFDGRLTLLAIESKNRALDLEPKIGIRLKTYTRQLVKTLPIISRVVNAEWALWQKGDVPLGKISVLSGGAFCWTGEQDLSKSLVRGKLDIAFAVEFKSIEQSALLHVKASATAELLLPKIHELAGQFGERLKIQVH